MNTWHDDFEVARWRRPALDDVRAYVDSTLRRFVRRANLPGLRIGSDIDDPVMCDVCGETLALVEETRAPSHDITDLLRYAKQWGVAAYIVRHDGPNPESLHLVRPHEDDEHAIDLFERESAEGRISPGIARGPAAVRLQLGLIVLRHLVAEHGPEHPTTARCARALRVQIADPPALRIVDPPEHE